MNKLYIDISNSEYITITDAKAIIKGYAKIEHYTDPTTHKTKYWYEYKLKSKFVVSKSMSKSRAIKEIRNAVDETYKDDLKEYQYY